MAKKATNTEVRYRVAVACGNKHFVLNYGDIYALNDLPKGVDLEGFLKCGFLEEFTGNVESLSSKALLSEAKALKEENDALKAMG